MLPPPSPSPPRRHDGARAESGARRRGARGGARGHLHARPARYVGLHPTLTQTLRTNAAPMRSTPRLLRRACALGSNDRNCEKNANRNNGNRLFDSQNNAAGGYACPRAVGGPERGNENGVAPFVNNQRSRMYYYEGSKMVVEWTNQHGCGSNSRVQCNVIIQYACEDSLDPFWAGTASDSWPAPGRPESCPGSPNRYPGVQGGQCFSRNTPENNCMVATPRDGIPDNANDAATDTIPNNANSAVPSDNTRRFGMHESYAYYDLYSRTERNNGLWTADQDVRRRDMRGTRQNPNGNRRGLEIPEERDYYPFWSPTPWRDVAVLSNIIAEDDTAYCDNVRAESQNVADKYFCEHPNKEDQPLYNQRRWPNTREGCDLAGGTWMRTPSFMRLAGEDGDADKWAPECGETSFSRTNQLGNAEITQAQKAAWDPAIPPVTAANRYIWTLPTVDDLRPTGAGSLNIAAEDYFPSSPGCKPGLSDVEVAMQNCVMRIRYNISTGDFDGWPEDMDGTADFATSRNNSRDSSGNDNPNSPLEQDPYSYLPAITTAPDGSFLSFAVNTNQYARTFQDRSYVFSIMPRPSDSTPRTVATDTPAVPTLDTADPVCDQIINVNMRGKRGNIVQTYPSVEYDFVPSNVCARCSGKHQCKQPNGDVVAGKNFRTFVHFQWMGSDYNPRRGCNNGEGGPPDPNPDGQTTNNNNARADRTNIAFITSPWNEAVNVLPDIPETIDASGLQAYMQSQQFWPCSAEDGTTSQACAESMYDLLFLRQGVNGEQGAQAFNGGSDCLTQDQLDDINGENNRNNHPQNCAKLNMKATPFFDGGLVEMTNCGSTFAFFSTRNNNFSNRDQTGTLKISDAPADPSDESFTCGYDGGPSLTGLADVTTIPLRQNALFGPCEEPAEGQANNNGAQSCIPPDGTTFIIDGDTFTIEEADNDNFGDGQAKGCEELVFFLDAGNSIEERIGLAIGLLFAGIAAAWGGVYLYNRWKARSAPAGNQGRTWQTEKATALNGLDKGTTAKTAAMI
uniref:Uncharacterized protein n=1 Tax=Phaeomonas parva TaxID=124430 RepID=A0A7S1XLR7_9STRA